MVEAAYRLYEEFGDLGALWFYEATRSDRFSLAYRDRKNTAICNSSWSPKLQFDRVRS